MKIDPMSLQVVFSPTETLRKAKSHQSKILSKLTFPQQYPKKRVI